MRAKEKTAKHSTLAWALLNEFSSLFLNGLEKEITRVEHIGFQTFIQMIDLKDVLFRESDFVLRRVSTNDEWDKRP